MSFSGGTPQQATKNRAGCLRLMILFILAGCILVAAGTYFALQQQAALRSSGIRLADAASDLGVTRRVMLQYYLAQNVAALDSPAGEAGPLSFAIPPGTTADEAATNLVELGLLQDRELFLTYLRFYGLDGRLQAGQYTLSGQLSVRDLADAITEGTGKDVTMATGATSPWSEGLPNAAVIAHWAAFPTKRLGIASSPRSSQ